ncbi:iron uptake transporter deferrochelatase/peroxidase subunit [Paenibacillus sp. 32352]|uniref:iron uptake transporter deferrochelatase/peroxidase subunit n=1 Tax=Paenibacillus sp. 32352 TaxID=1969111 RepID=UPI0009ACDFEC|nr:iron uptake transporter deferrochelatase/peroxidase subunit [Paenibacillus sp. 32352]
MDDMTKQDQEHLPDSKSTVSRRDILKMAGAGGIGLLLGSVGVGVGGLLTGTGKASKSASAATDRSQSTIPFYDQYQAGILTPAQNFLCFAAFDLTTKQASEVTKLFRAWTEASANMAEGRMVGSHNDQPSLPPEDTGEAVGLNANQLTITFGVGPSMFDERFGLASKRPEAFVDFPKFAGERLREEWCGGDIGVQVCADDMQVAFHAIRNLARIARGTAVLRWTQEGFQRSATATNIQETPRNLLGFKDGTGNPDVRDSKLMNDLVWVQSSDGPSWMQNGTYMAVRRIRMRIEVWDRSTLSDQEATFGRYRSSGAPLGQSNEFDPLQLDAKNADGKPVIPANAHIRLAHGENKEKILRRSYSYSSGIDKQTGQLDAGLFFICFNRDPRKQFIPIQQRLAKNDALNEYIFHMGSASFACFPGVRQGGYIGEGLL